MNVTLVATCLFGLEKMLGDEIDALGYKRLETIDGRVTFSGDAAAIARCNIWLRCAERVYIRMGQFPARTFGELFDGTKELPWEEWIGREDAFPVKGHSVKSTLFSIPDCQSIIKKAVAKRLDDEYGMCWFPETRTKYQIEFFILRDTVTLMIDTSGTALHKRGYRPETFSAPLRETLAAAIVLSSRPRENVLLWDPFCGTGTLAIEAAMLMTRRAPGLLRGFAGEAFENPGREAWKLAREEARDVVVKNSAFEAYASDIDPQAVRMASECSLRAGVADRIKVFEKDALTLKRPDRRGTVVTNPPYGERLMTPAEAEELYRRMGSVFGAFAPWQVYILTSNERFERLYGKRADKVRKLYNGMIPCYLYEYFKNEK